MAEEKDIRRKDEGVKIEIHGGEDPAADAGDLKDEAVSANEAGPEVGDAGEKPDEAKAGKETAKAGSTPEGDKADGDGSSPKDGGPEKGSGAPEDEQPAEDGKEEPEKAAGDGKSGKGFFGFKNKKDKKDEKIEQLTDQVARQLAEFDNYRKRTDREKAAMFDMGRRDVVEKILPVVDNFERGLGDIEKEDDDPFRQGMIKIYRQLMKALEDMGVSPIEAEGKPFDPNFHNAVMHCEDDSVGESIVVQDLQKGYVMNDTVIRHSMVKVAN